MARPLCCSPIIPMELSAGATFYMVDCIQSFILLTGIIAEALVNQPFWYFVFVRGFNIVGSASKKSLTQRMSKRQSMGIVPGGFHEASISEVGTDRAYIKERKGFM